MDMIERVAVALIERIGSPWHSFEQMPEPVKMLWRGHARAAIEALREPTIGMRDAGFIYCEGDTASQASNACLKAWQDMIDAALGEKVG